MKCSSCGYEYRDGDKFCPNCGAATQTVDSNNGFDNNNGFNSNNGYNNNNSNNYNNNNFNNYNNNNNSNYNNNSNSNYNNTGYNNGYNQSGYGGNFTAPIKKRDIVLCIILSIVTCGIYGIIWLIGIVDDLNVAAGTPEDTSGVVVFLLTLITCGIYGIYWAYTAGEKINSIHERSGQRREEYTGILYLVLNLFQLSIVTYCLIQSELNKIASY